MMNYETKRNVFDDALTYAPVGREYDPVNDDDAGDLRSCLSARYAAALPDNLPVIPKEVSDRLKQAKVDRSSLRYMFSASSIGMLSDCWMAQNPKNEDTFARAWLLGVWSVEKTGEIVNLEAEK